MSTILMPLIVDFIHERVTILIIILINVFLQADVNVNGGAKKMKKFLTILLCIGMIISSAFPVFANESDQYTAAFNQILEENGFEGCTVGVSVPMVRYGDIKKPDLTYDELIEQTTFRMAPMFRDGKVVGEVGFSDLTGEWKFTGGMENGSALYDTIEKYGTNILYIFGEGDQIVVLPESGNPLHSLYEATERAEPSFFSNTPEMLSDYILCVSYDNAVSVSETTLSGGRPAFDDAYLAQATAYWEKHSGFSVGIWIVGVVIVSGITCGLLYVLKKRRN